MSSDLSKLPLSLQRVQSQLSNGHGIEIRALPAGLHLAVSKSAAVTTALGQSGRSQGDDVEAYAVAATANHYGDEQSDGTLKLRIEDRAVWLVLIRNVQMPNRGRGGPTSYRATQAVLVDANTGEYLMSASA